MSIDLVTEILAAHADELIKGQEVSVAKFLEAYPDRRAELTPLLDLASQLKQTLKPVAPSSSFRVRLHDGLMMAAHHQETHRILVERRAEPQWGWLIGAAAIGSAAGVIALVMRSRTHENRSIAEGQPSPTAN
ncbi:MAG: hypothetical protein M1570_19160 [Chloroflexi bacterium]|nr:hypothetical protein [Chloroflexota bacterium]